MSEHTTTDQTPAPDDHPRHAPDAATRAEHDEPRAYDLPTLAERRAAHAQGEHAHRVGRPCAAATDRDLTALTRTVGDPSPQRVRILSAEYVTGWERADDVRRAEAAAEEARAEAAEPLSVGGVWSAARMLAEHFGIPVVSHAATGRTLADHLAGSAVTTDRLAVPADAARRAYAYLTAEEPEEECCDPLDVPDPSTVARLVRSALCDRVSATLAPQLDDAHPDSAPQDEPAGCFPGDRSVDEQRPGRATRDGSPEDVTTVTRDDLTGIPLADLCSDCPTPDYCVRQPGGCARANTMRDAEPPAVARCSDPCCQSDEPPTLDDLAHDALNALETLLHVIDGAPDWERLARVKAAARDALAAWDEAAGEALAAEEPEPEETPGETLAALLGVWAADTLAGLIGLPVPAKPEPAPDLTGLLIGALPASVVMAALPLLDAALDVLDTLTGTADGPDQGQ